MIINIIIIASATMKMITDIIMIIIIIIINPVRPSRALPGATCPLSERSSLRMLVRCTAFLFA